MAGGGANGHVESKDPYSVIELQWAVGCRSICG